MLISLLLLAAGIVLLVLAGNALVKGAVGLAERLGIAPLIIGLTVVAFGTSMPEMLVSLQAAFGGSPGIAVGNVVGSNIANVFLVLGLPALIASVLATDKGIRRNISVMLGTTAVFMFFMWDGTIERWEGGVLLAALFGFVVWQVLTAQSGELSTEDLEGEVGGAPHTAGRIAATLIGGLVGLPIAAQLTINGAVGIAERFGISDTVIGLTIVAVGTSLPELATTLAAAVRRNTGVAIGNVVGSNIFNIMGIMGLTALLFPMSVDQRMISIDMWVMAGAAVIVAIFGYGRIAMGRLVGVAMLAGFVAYMVTMI